VDVYRDMLGDVHSNRIFVVVATAAMLGLVACGGGGGGGHATATTPSTTSGAVGTGSSSTGPRQVNMSAKSFSFSPKLVTVNTGQQLTIVLKSTDIEHDFVIDELHANIDVQGNTTKTGSVATDKPGRYTFYCSIPGHRAAGMVGTLVVV